MTGYALLIEHNRTLGLLYKKAIERDCSTNVVWFGDPQDAIAYCDKNRPDIIICDLFLNTHSGMEFLYEFRSYSDWQNVRIILITHHLESKKIISKKILKELGVEQFIFMPEKALRDLVVAVGRQKNE